MKILIALFAMALAYLPSTSVGADLATSVGADLATTAKPTLAKATLQLNYGNGMPTDFEVDVAEAQVWDR